MPFGLPLRTISPCCRCASVTSSTAERCLQTVAPLAEALGRRVKENAGISQDAYEIDGGSVRETVAKRVRKARSAVLCSHSPVLPEILYEIALAQRADRAAVAVRAHDVELESLLVKAVASFSRGVCADVGP